MTKFFNSASRVIHTPKSSYLGSSLLSYISWSVTDFADFCGAALTFFLGSGVEGSGIRLLVCNHLVIWSDFADKAEMSNELIISKSTRRIWVSQSGLAPLLRDGPLSSLGTLFSTPEAREKPAFCNCLNTYTVSENHYIEAGICV